MARLSSILNEYKWHFIGATAAALFIGSVKRYCRGGVCKSKVRLDGKTIIITGGNSGIGKETALDLARRGARVIIASRDEDKSNKVAQEIRSQTGNGNIVVCKLDLSSFQSVKSFANKINSEEERIDVLINNAGLCCYKKKSVDGHDLIFQSNHLGPFLLTNLLLEKIKKTKNSRIINVSSRAYSKGKMNWDDLMFDKTKYIPFNAYRQSKLANILFTRELAKRLTNTSVTVNALHPGIVGTEIYRDVKEAYGLMFTLIKALFLPLLWLCFKSVEDGAQTTIYLAVSDEVNGVSGKYFCDCKCSQLKLHALNDEDGMKLWSVSEQYLKDLM